jgi:hypothetical protein
MGQRVIKFVARIASTCVGLLGAVKDALGRASRYRPEAHYMRGPGPKCRARNLQILDKR